MALRLSALHCNCVYVETLRIARGDDGRWRCAYRPYIAIVFTLKRYASPVAMTADGAALIGPTLQLCLL